MSEILLNHEPAIRLAIGAGVFILVALGEVLMPRRLQRFGRGLRWPNNLGVVLVNTALVRVVLPVTAVALAVLAEQRGWGLLNLLGVTDWIALPLAILALDLMLYTQHVLFHFVPAFWRLHRMHHADLEFDVSTGLRFHPVEILLSMILKFAVIVALGPSALAVLIFEILLNASSQFNHANLRLPESVDRSVRLVLVTPDMHRVHHSIVRKETDSNFGFTVPWWDRLFGTYLPQPAAGHLDMIIGTPQFRTAGELRLHRMLMQPLRSG